MAYKLIVTPRADKQLERIERWWTTNRPEAGTAIRESFSRAFEMLTAFPECGVRIPANKRVWHLTDASYTIRYALRQQTYVVIISLRGPR